MPGLILHTSNQLDLLAQRLSEVVSAPLGSPFTPEIVVVQSLASRRWLSLQIAQRQRICANYHFPFLGDLIAQIVQQASPAVALGEKISADLLTWKIDSLLPRCLARKEFVPVAQYLRDGDSLKRFQLSGRLANLFDQYRVYRPEMVSGWAASKKKQSKDEAWQAALWRQLGEAPGFDQALEHLRTRGFEDGAQLDLPERISIFAPASLPPAYLELLLRLARVREVHLFLLRPSREYRGNDPTAKQRARLGLGNSDPATGNPLVTSWGKVDADLTDLLLESEERLGVAVENWSEEFRDFEPVNLLGTLKSDILGAQNRGAGGAAAAGDDSETAPRMRVSADDRSLVLHSCYSPMREVEVLYDQLLSYFETMPDLQPRDIIVMTPEIEKYAPLIRGVFGYPEKDAMRIPYSLADRHPRSESLAIDTFLTLLELPGSRYAASQIFALLGSRALRHRFRFSDEDLSLIRDWIEETGIRWGVDAADRDRAGLPALDANTWRHGLKRLLLGYGMEGKGQHLFEGILPHDEVEGDGAEVLGRFVSAAEALFALTETFAQPRPLASWVEPLQQAVEQFLDPVGEEELQDVLFLRVTIDRLRTLDEATEARSEVDFRLVRHHLIEQLGRMEQRGNFFQGGVTFCALKPVRSIPARVVCLLGINDQVFPRRPQPTQFDLMARSPRTGDPSARQDDRYSFLETLLSAQERLSISYVGRSAVHNKEIPPSVVVSELLDYLNQAFAFPGKKPAGDFVLTEHPLQAFSPRYFSRGVGERFFSYSEANAEASRSVTGRGAPAMPPFITDPLPQVEEAKRSLELRDLIEFWKNPSKYFVRKRLSLSLWENDDTLSDNEPFELDHLDQYHIKQELLADELETGELLPPAVFQARGILPAGAMGELQLRSMKLEVQKLAKIVEGHIRNGKKDEPIDVDLQLETFRIGGKIHSLYRGKSVLFRTAKLNPKDRLRAWIEHLVLCALAKKGGEAETVLIGRDKVVTFGGVASARTELQTLCELFWQGSTLPLRFFPASALAFAEAERAGVKNPFSKARAKWDGMYRRNEKREGEKDDVFIARCFDGPDLLDERFAALARIVFTPMLQHSREEEL